MISELRKSNLKEAIAYAFHQCRAKTLAVFEGMDKTTFCHQAHPDFSPVGWHLGHIAYTESLWLLERSAGSPCLFPPQYRKLFAADGLPKTERVKLPNLEEILDYLNAVRKKVLDYLEVADLEQEERLWHFLLQHESQHTEIITFVLELSKLQHSTLDTQHSKVIPTLLTNRGVGESSAVSPALQEGFPPQATGASVAVASLLPRGDARGERASPVRVLGSQCVGGVPRLVDARRAASPRVATGVSPQVKQLANPEGGREWGVGGRGPLSEMIHIPAGEFEMGNDSIDALDNERPRHRVYLEAYWIDLYPVACGQYREFIEAEGYQNSCWWSQPGWEWLQTEQVTQPLYWCNDPQWDSHPVCGVNWYEAEAYSRFVGKRLPTEAEWEKAAGGDAKVNHRRIDPWGDEKSALEHSVSIANEDSYPSHSKILDRSKDVSSKRMGKTTPVGADPAQVSAYGLYDTLGNVWEWTASWFDGYPGFQSYPYVGYSQVYFDQQHRVLKGGSWATNSWVLRSSFRNWYYPSVRQILAGFRCAADCFPHN